MSSVPSVVSTFVASVLPQVQSLRPRSNVLVQDLAAESDALSAFMKYPKSQRQEDRMETSAIGGKASSSPAAAPGPRHERENDNTSTLMESQDETIVVGMSNGIVEFHTRQNVITCAHAQITLVDKTVKKVRFQITTNIHGVFGYIADEDDEDEDEVSQVKCEHVARTETVLPENAKINLGMPDGVKELIRQVHVGHINLQTEYRSGQQCVIKFTIGNETFGWTVPTSKSDSKGAETPPVPLEVFDSAGHARAAPATEQEVTDAVNAYLEAQDEAAKATAAKATAAKATKGPRTQDEVIATQ